MLVSVLVYFHFSGIFELIFRDISRIFSAIGDNLYIRGIIIQIALLGSIEHFPFGFGFGNFATPSAWNSKVYSDFGVSKLSFFVDESPSVFDSNLSSVLGSTGILGLLCYAGILYFSINQWLTNYTSKIKILVILNILLIGLMLPIFSNASLGLIIALLLRVKHNENSASK